MILSLHNEALIRYVETQINTIFPDSTSLGSAIANCINRVLERMEACFSAIYSRHFRSGNETIFNHLNSDHYAMFLYFLANTLYGRDEDVRICEKIFYLNKLLHGIDVFYSVELPDIFLFCHPLGTVLGRAKYSDYFLVYQRCTVGASRELGMYEKNEYPVLGKYVSLYMGSAVLGKCEIGENCKISSNSLILDRNLNDNSIYIGTTTNYFLKNNSRKDAIWGDRVDT